MIKGSAKCTAFVLLSSEKAFLFVGGGGYIQYLVAVFFNGLPEQAAVGLSFGDDLCYALAV